jgi:hypothetical protein
MPYIPTPPTTSKSAVIITTSSGKTITIDDCFIEYLDLISYLLEMNVSYREFTEMSDIERKSFIKGMKRGIKINELNI